MIVVFMIEQGTLKITDDFGESLHERGDDKIMCPNEMVAEVVIDALGQLTGNMFFRTHEEAFIRWENNEINDYHLREALRCDIMNGIFKAVYEHSNVSGNDLVDSDEYNELYQKVTDISQFVASATIRIHKDKYETQKNGD